MKVAILAAGKGSRLGELGNHIPKSMLDIGSGQTLLGRLINGFRRYSNEVIVVSGHRSDILDPYSIKSGANLVINNPYYKNTNNITSLRLVFDKINVNDSLLVVDADTYLSDKALSEIISIIDIARDSNDSIIFTTSLKRPEGEWSIDIDSLDKKSLCISDNIYKVSGVNKNPSISKRITSGVTYFRGSGLKLLSREIYLADNNDYWDSIYFNYFREMNLKTYDLSSEVYEIDTLEDISKLHNITKEGIL